VALGNLPEPAHSCRHAKSLNLLRFARQWRVDGVFRYLRIAPPLNFPTLCMWCLFWYTLLRTPAARWQINLDGPIASRKDAIGICGVADGADRT
jgi:hypothetical protein